jgi:hypothetical protein
MTERRGSSGGGSFLESLVSFASDKHFSPKYDCKIKSSAACLEGRKPDPYLGAGIVKISFFC